MKTLADGTEVLSRTYYYLLEWNDHNRKIYMSDTFHKNRLADLSIVEYKLLFEHAANVDLQRLNFSNHDGTEVMSRTTNYLIQWNNADMRQYMNKKFNKLKLDDLTKTEYQLVFQHATEDDLKRL